MWTHNYTPLSGSLGLSALVAAVPIFMLVVLLGILRKPAWLAALCGLARRCSWRWDCTACRSASCSAAVTYGAAQGLFPIGWVVFTAVLLYRITQETGKFEIIKDSIGISFRRPRLQALLIAFAFGAFIEGASGFGTPDRGRRRDAHRPGILAFLRRGDLPAGEHLPGRVRIDRNPDHHARSGSPGLPEMRLSAGVGRICAPLSLFVPAYLIAVMGGWKALRGVLLACGGVRRQLRRRCSS